MSLDSLEPKIRKLLLHHLEFGNISLVDSAALAYILSEAEDETIEEYLKKLSSEFPIFNEIFEDQKSEIKENLEQIVQNFVKSIIKDNPLLAAQISQTAFKKDMTIAKLKEKYPEFEEYLNK